MVRITHMTTLLVLAGLLVLVLIGGLGLGALTEAGRSNSYALLAEAFLNGRLHTTDCFDLDCARFEDKIFVMFPPLPAVIAMPFVALFGVEFSGFILLSVIVTALSVLLWWEILAELDVEPEIALWLLLGLAFATPLYFVTIRGDGVWFFAQSIGFLLTSLAIHQVLRGGSLVLAGFCIGMGFLCRQMIIFYLPFLFALALRRDERLISFSGAHIMRALKLGLPVVAAVGVYLVYNYARFGDPMQTGYPYMIVPDLPQDRTVIDHRLAEHGLWSSAYLLFNALYLFVQGFHFNFSGASLLDPAGLDRAGTSLLAASPFVLLAFFTPLRRPVVIGIVTISAMVVPLLFYHSNGYSQFNVQRYVLDWLPILFYMLALAVTTRELRALAVLVVYGLGLNVVTMALLATGLGV